MKRPPSLWRQLVSLFCLLAAVQAAAAQPTTVRPDPRIERLVAAISADSIEADIRTLVSFGTRHTLSDTDSDGTGIGAARRWIERTLDRYARAGGGHMEVFFDTFLYPADGRRVDRDVILKNVVARLPGTDPDDDRVFIVTGHYDSRVTNIMDSTSYAPGANDDASGTASVMEMARVLAAERFPATIVMAAVAGEEQGLLGSTHLAHLADSLNWNVAGMITLDVVGNTLGDNGVRDNRTVRLFSEGVPAAETERQARLRSTIGGENDSPARQLARYFEEVGERYVPYMDVKLIYRRDRFLRGGDHLPFSALGFPAVRMTEPNEAFTRQHQDVRVENGIHYGDVPEYVDFAYAADVARIVAASFANLALAPPPPTDVHIDASGLSVDTRLFWQQPDAGRDRIAGYNILIRETTAPVWQEKRFVGDVTEFTFPGLSKDDYFFGVQSVDRSGHESSIIVPTPASR